MSAIRVSVPGRPTEFVDLGPTTHHRMPGMPAYGGAIARPASSISAADAERQRQRERQRLFREQMKAATGRTRPPRTDAQRARERELQRMRRATAKENARAWMEGQA